MADQASAGVGLGVQDLVYWRCHTRVDKYWGDWPQPVREELSPDPYDVVEKSGNLLVIGGASSLFQYAIGNGTATAAQPLTYLNNAQAALGVGDSNTAAADTQTNLQAATNKLYKAMDATYPLHTDTTGTAGSKSAVWRSTFTTSDANWAWLEWGLFNGTAPGRMINRKQENLGTKTALGTWVLTVTLSLA